MPGRREQSPLARISVGEANADLGWVGRRAGARGVETRADADRADAIGGAGGQTLSGGDDVRQALEGLDHRDVVGGVHGWRGRMGDHVEQARRRSLAVEFGEEGRRATDDWQARKRPSQRGGDGWLVWRWRPRLAGLERLPVGSRKGADRCRPQAAAFEELRKANDLAFRVIGAD